MRGRHLSRGARAGTAALALIALQLCAARAQTPPQNPGPNPLTNPNDSQPIQIQANNGIEWQQNAQVYIARGNAVATRGTSGIARRTLVARYTAKQGAQPASASGSENQMGNTESTGSTQTAASCSSARRRPWSATTSSTMSIRALPSSPARASTDDDDNMVTARDGLEW